MGPSSQSQIYWIIILVAALVGRSVPVSLAEIPTNSSTARKEDRQAQYKNEHTNKKHPIDHHRETNDSSSVGTRRTTNFRHNHHHKSAQTRDGKNLHSPTNSGQKVGREGSERKNQSNYTVNRTNQHHTNRNPQPHQRQHTHYQPSTGTYDPQDRPRVSSKATTNEHGTKPSAHNTHHTLDSVPMAQKDAQSNSGGNGHDDRTGNENVDWKSISPAFYEESHRTPRTRDSLAAKRQPLSRSNEHDSIGVGGEDPNKMIVVICSVVFLVILSLYQLWLANADHWRSSGGREDSYKRRRGPPRANYGRVI